MFHFQVVKTDYPLVVVHSPSEGSLPLQRDADAYPLLALIISSPLGIGQFGPPRAILHADDSQVVMLQLCLF